MVIGTEGDEEGVGTPGKEVTEVGWGKTGSSKKEKEKGHMGEDDGDAGRKGKVVS